MPQTGGPTSAWLLLQYTFLKKLADKCVAASILELGSTLLFSKFQVDTISVNTPNTHTYAIIEHEVVFLQIISHAL